MSKQFSKLSKSSKSTEYGTPKDFFDKLNSIFKFELDPATTLDNPLGTKHYYFKNLLPHNGLTGSWPHNTFINPPFGKGVREWINKMNEESVNFNKVYVMLLPSRTDTKWFQDLIWKKGSTIYFLKGRLKFVNPVLNGKSEPHIIGSMLWIRNAIYEHKQQLSKNIPGVMVEL